MSFNTEYVAGAWNAICDRCGFQFKSNQLRLEPWTNLRVCDSCLDKRNPQEFLRVKKEKITPEWTRPDTEFVPTILGPSVADHAWASYPEKLVHLDATAGAIIMGQDMTGVSFLTHGNTIFSYVRIDSSGNTCSVQNHLVGMSSTSWAILPGRTLKLIWRNASSRLWEVFQAGDQ